MKILRYLKPLLTATLLAVAVPISHAGSGLFMHKTIQLPTMRTHCIGRYQIDLPEEYAMTPGSELTLFYGLGKDFEKVQVTVPRQRGEQPEFNQLLKKTVNEFRADAHDDSPSKSMLAQVKKLDNFSSLILAYKNSMSSESFRLNLYAQRNEAIIRVEGFKYSRDARTLDYVENQLIQVAQSTRFAASPDQAGPASCLGTAVIDAKQDGEVYSLTFKSQKHPDVLFSIDMNSLPEKGDGGLLHRVDDKAGLLRALDFSSSTLRRGKRLIAGRAGEELLDAGKERDKVQRYFVAETLVTEPSNINRPVIAISMSIGGQKAGKGNDYLDPSLNEKESLAWWDAVVGSVRLR